MAEEPEPVAAGDSSGWNYFNYFTEVEDHFQRARGSGLFLMSPVDWAIVETWKNAGVPLEAVLRGIDTAFEKWRKRPKPGRSVNSVAYCAQAVTEEAQVMAGGAPVKQTAEAPFTIEELETFFRRNVEQLRGRPELSTAADLLEDILNELPEWFGKLEQLEQKLTAIEDRMSATVRAAITEDELFAMRQELDSTLRPYRSKMTAEQIALLERQFLDRRVQERAGLPRLSLFYLKD